VRKDADQRERVSDAVASHRRFGGGGPPRAKFLEAMVAVVAERGFALATVTALTNRVEKALK
jgi:hypothetical protein